MAAQRQVWFVIVMFGFFAVLSAGMGSYFAWRWHQSTTWPTTDGRVTESRTDQYEKTNKGRTTTMYRAAVTYAYEVNGRELTSSEVGLGSYSSSDRSDAEEQVAKYPTGGRVTVHYNPSQPDDAVLEVGFPWVLLVPVFLTLVFGGLAVGLPFTLGRG